MNSQLLPALPCLLACALAAGAAQAQIAPTRFEIRLWEQEGNVVIPLERRLYSTRFDAGRSRIIGMEIVMSHAPAKATAILPVDCELRAPEGDRPGSQNLEIKVATGAAESRGVAMWIRAGDPAWVPGDYRVHCNARGSVLGEVPFQMAMNPPDASEIDLHVKQMHLFPASGPLPARDQRDYMTRFPARKTSRIGVELEFTHAQPGGTMSIPIDCYYYPPSGQAMGPISFTYEPQADATSGNAGLAMGWDSPGRWSQGQYAAVCNIRGRPVAVERFTVD
jgi:hypothetical protein